MRVIRFQMRNDMVKWFARLKCSDERATHSTLSIGSTVSIAVIGCAMLAMIYPTQTIAAEQAGAITLYAAPNGSGTECSETAPCTLQAAKTRVQALIAEAPRDITVQLANGVYGIDQPLIFGAADSGRENHTVRYVAATQGMAVLSGAVPVRNWKLVDPKSNLWSASLPDQVTPNPETGMLPRFFFVDGKRAERARLDVNPIVSGRPIMQVGKVTRDHHYEISLPGMEAWRHIQDLELVYTNHYTMVRCPVASITSGSITLDPVCQNALEKNFVIRSGMGLNWLENNPAFLKKRGQWVLDSSERKIDYMAQPGQDMNKTNAMLARTEKLIVLNSASHLQFDGLKFEMTNWYGYRDKNSNRPYVGYTAHQSGDQGQLHQQPLAAVEIASSHDVTIRRANFTNLGGTGVIIGTGSSDIEVTSSSFTYNAAAGLQIGSPKEIRETNPTSQNANIRIENNRFSHNGFEYWDNPGVMAYALRDSSITHNEISNCGWSCLALGWGWDVVQTYNQNVTIAHNWIHDAMQQLDDGGGIYTNGKTTGTNIIDGNVIERIGNLNVSECGNGFDGHPFHGIYHDQGSDKYQDINNLVLNIAPPKVSEPEKDACRGSWLVLSGDIDLIKGNASDSDIVVGSAKAKLLPDCDAAKTPTQCLAVASDNLISPSVASTPRAKSIRAHAGAGR